MCGIPIIVFVALTTVSLTSTEYEKSVYTQAETMWKKRQSSTFKEREITEVTNKRSYTGGPTIAGFMEAYKKQTVEQIEELHKKHRVSFKATIGWHTVLECAVRVGNPALVSFLIDTKHISNKFSETRTALSSISYEKTDARNKDVAHKYIVVLKKLIHEGSLINEVGSSGQTAALKTTPLARYIAENWLEITPDDPIIKEYIAQGAALVTTARGQVYNVFIPLLNKYAHDLPTHTADQQYTDKIGAIMQAVFYEKVKSIQKVYLQFFWIRQRLGEQKKITFPKGLALFFADTIADEQMETIIAQFTEVLTGKISDLIQAPHMQLLSAAHKPNEALHRLINLTQWKADWKEFKQYKDKSNQPNMIVDAFNKQ